MKNIYLVNNSTLKKTYSPLSTIPKSYADSIICLTGSDEAHITITEI
jgi:hypothetical protein